jgi:ribonuclease-3
VVSGEGPDHARIFTARVRVGDRLYGHGVGKTKKQAEQIAAEGAFTELQGSAAGDA